MLMKLHLGESTYAYVLVPAGFLGSARCTPYRSLIDIDAAVVINIAPCKCKCRSLSMLTGPSRERCESNLQA